MTEPAMRVALLARSGEACERLRAALQEAGVEVVLVADPSESEPEQVTQADPQAVLVALEPSLEDALERFETLLADPAMTVIFDEAELAAAREGWDAARWMRHLVAKLHRHHDVLPPGGEDEPEFDLEPGRLGLYQVPEGDGDLTGIAGEAELMVDAVPRDAPDQVSWTIEADNTALDSGLTLGPLGDNLAVETEWSEEFAEGGAAIEEAEVDESVAHERFQDDLHQLHERAATMHLADDVAPPIRADKRSGAVVVLAGLGGPDAVRQLLAGLPGNFPRPLLIQQRLDGGRHDKLVRQMQRATTMPVQLAHTDDVLQGGHVYVLPTGIGVIVAADGTLSFGPDDGEVFATLPADDSAVILLSGSDPAIVDAAMNHAGRGSLVAGQAPEGCYDADAAKVLIARGAQSGSPAQLADKLSARWPG